MQLRMNMIISSNRSNSNNSNSSNNNTLSPQLNTTVNMINGSIFNIPMINRIHGNKPCSSCGGSRR
jgi:hypothetical protein